LHTPTVKKGVSITPLQDSHNCQDIAEQARNDGKKYTTAP